MGQYDSICKWCGKGMNRKDKDYLTFCCEECEVKYRKFVENIDKQVAAGEFRHQPFGGKK